MTQNLVSNSEGSAPDTLADIFFETRRSRGWSLRDFEAILEKKVSFASLARIERGEILVVSDEILVAVSPYTQPYKSFEELKLIALSEKFSNNSTDKISYSIVLKAALTLSKADQANLIQDLTTNLS